MRAGNLLFSAVQFLFVVVLLCVGIGLIKVSTSPYLVDQCSRFFAEREGFLTFLGVLIVILGVVMLIGFYSMHQGRYLRVEMRDRTTQVEAAIIKEYVEQYWKSAFPDQVVRSDVWIYPDQRIEIAAHMPLLSLEEQYDVLKSVEKELGDILLYKVGYKRDFLFNLVIS